MDVSGVEDVILNQGRKFMDFEIDKKKVEIFYNETTNKRVPVIILNTFNKEGNDIWEEGKRINTHEYILVAISSLNWNDDLSPWKCDPLYKGDSEYKGYANKYIEQIESKIIPRVDEVIENILNKQVEYYAIAGYSLGGLFALYSTYKTDLFKRVVSASGSLWYPNFTEFVKTNEISKKVEKIYFSLGNKEKNTKNIFLREVENNTKIIYNYLRQNIKTVYEENEGNHFQDTAFRMAKGIKWILE